MYQFKQHSNLTPVKLLICQQPWRKEPQRNLSPRPPTPCLRFQSGPTARGKSLLKSSNHLKHLTVLLGRMSTAVVPFYVCFRLLLRALSPNHAQCHSTSCFKQAIQFRLWPTPPQTVSSHCPRSQTPESMLSLAEHLPEQPTPTLPTFCRVRTSAPR